MFQYATLLVLVYSNNNIKNIIKVLIEGDIMVETIRKSHKWGFGIVADVSIHIISPQAPYTNKDLQGQYLKGRA